ncbi:type VI secretion system tip protein TssI/VgrG [Trinickia sp.]|uniref:type VI secretion system tip protein TssI/VgrG n=1 Tax=Trinickia sp. TaxID=2571163 RepID=UPI003F7FA010
MTGRSELVPIDFHCAEGLSLVYEIDVRFASQDANIELKQMIGQPVTLSLELTTAWASSERRHFHGYVTNFSHLDTDGGLTVYRATLRPWLWMLSRRQDQRIFQEETAQSILSEVFRAYGALASFEFRLSKPTPNRSYCTQYRETDLTFALRLMEEEGLFFYFEHTKTGHKLVVTDSSTTAKPIGGLSASLLYSQDEILDDVDVVTAFHGSRHLESNVSAIKTVDYKVPAARRSAVQRASIEQGDVPSYEIYDYLGSHAYPAGDRGNELARFRAEALAAGSKIFSGVTTSRRLMPRHYFELEGHYDHTSTNPEDNQFMVVTATHRAQNNYQAGDGAAAYSCSFTCIRKKIPYRPPLTIERPVIAGPQTVTIVGPKGEEIYTDALGRVKGQFHWDRLGQMDHRSSCWMRVGQQWAGKGFGMIQIPRIGEEGVVLFLDGNPDRPLIISRVYNAVNVPPWSLPANATQSGILTRSSKGATSANANALRFEDKKGQEEIWLHAEKDQRIEVEHDESHTVGHDRSKSVGRDETGHVGRHWKLSTDGYKQETVKLASVSSVGLGAMFNVGMAYNVNVGGLYLRNVGLQMASTVGTSRTDRVVQDWTAHVGHSYTVTVRGKAVGDAVSADQANPIEPSPDFAPQLPAPVSSPESNQIRITDQGQASLSGSKTAQLIGPGGTVTIDASGIHLKGTAIYLEGPVTQSSGSAKSLAPVTEADCAICKAMSAHPVDIATGQKLLEHDDFVLPGRLPIRWNRRYRSADQRAGSLGAAWKLQYATEVRLETAPDGAGKLVYIDFDGRRLNFPLLEVGQEHFHPLEKYTLVRLDDRDGHAVYAVRFSDGAVETYEPHPVIPNQWQLCRLETRDRQSLSFAYTQSGSLQAIRNNVYNVGCRHDDQGRVTEVHLLDEQGDSKTKLAAYEYDDHGDLIKAVDQGGGVWRYAYHNHLLTSYETPAGATFVSEWDGDAPSARCVRTYGFTRDEAGKPMVTRETRFEYAPATQSTRVTDAMGNVTAYRHNGLWMIDQIVHPDGSIEITEFDDKGNVSARVDALGRRTQTVSDERGNPVAVRDAAGYLTRIEYNEQNLPIRITDPAGQIWQREYDAEGHLVKEIDPLGNTKSTEFDKGLPVAHTDALGNVTHMQWNDAGLLVARTDCSGFTTQYGYDDLGRPVSQTNALGQTSKTKLNAAGQPTVIEPAGLGQWKIAYDDAGRPVSHIDPLGRIQRVAWDAYGRPLIATDAVGGTHRFEYDDQGRLTVLINPKGERSSFAYDMRGRIAAQVGFDGRRQQFRYNGADELVERIDFGRDGQLSTTLLYDNRGHLIERRGSDGVRTTFAFDERGLPTQARHEPEAGEASQITYEYDAAGRRTAEIQSHHGRVWRLQHRLDAAGNRSELYVPGTGKLAWQRYGSGHVHDVLLDGVSLASFERDALHRAVLATQGTVAQLLAYTEAGRIASQRLQDLDERGGPRAEPRPWRTWDYDRAGQLVSLKDAWRGEKHYSYDPLARLIHVMRPSGGEAVADVTSETYRYDPAGNLLARIVGDRLSESALARSESHAVGDRLIQFIDADAEVAVLHGFDYDGHGNRTEQTAQASSNVLVSKPSGMLDKLLSRQAAAEAKTTASANQLMRYRYDAAHRLVSVEQSDGARTEYRYDALGRRIAKVHTVTGELPRLTLFVWDGDWMLQEVHAGAAVRTDVVVTFVAHPDHQGPLSRISGGRRYHYLNDHLGTPQELVDDARRVVWAADFDGYGEARREFVAEVDNPLRFPGQYHDRESRLHYNRHRYYDPKVGRYISKDPIGLAGGLNPYAYAKQDPINRFDPLGLVDIGKDIPGATGETSIHANPGPNVTDYRAEHGPDHIHLGKNDGPRVSTETWKPFSSADAARMSNAQTRFCKKLSDEAKIILTKRQREIFSFGKLLGSFGDFFVIHDSVKGAAKALCQSGDVDACAIFRTMGGEVEGPEV